LHNSGKWFTLSDLGAYSIMKLESFLAGSEQFIPSELAEKFINTRLFRSYNNMSKTGSVSCPPTSYFTFPLCRERNSRVKLYHDEIVLEWHLSSSFVSFEVTKRYFLLQDLMSNSLSDTFFIENEKRLEFKLDRTSTKEKNIINKWIMADIVYEGKGEWRIRELDRKTKRKKKPKGEKIKTEKYYDVPQRLAIFSMGFKNTKLSVIT
jgi:hypothetical protein